MRETGLTMEILDAAKAEWKCDVRGQAEAELIKFDTASVCAFLQHHVGGAKRTNSFTLNIQRVSRLEMFACFDNERHGKSAVDMERKRPAHNADRCGIEKGTKV
jgi:hypothetical protein